MLLAQLRSVRCTISAHVFGPPRPPFGALCSQLSNNSRILYSTEYHLPNRGF